MMDGPQSAIWDEAENRIHAQKAILACSSWRREPDHLLNHQIEARRIRLGYQDHHAERRWPAAQGVNDGAQGGEALNRCWPGRRRR